MITENKFEWTDELVSEFVFFKSRFNFPEFKDIVEAFKKYKLGNDFLWAERENESQQNTIQKDWEIVRAIWRGNNTEIESVRRLSDGEVFSLGDDVGYSQNPYKTFKIDSFNVIGHNMMAVNSVGRELNIIILNNNKKPLFQTEDGKDVYEGGEFVAVQKTTFDMLCCRQTLTNPENYYIFSNEEKANNWVLMNKPVLSVNDVLAVCENNYGFLQNKLLDRLKEIAKSKIEGK